MKIEILSLRDGRVMLAATDCDRTVQFPCHVGSEAHELIKRLLDQATRELADQYRKDLLQQVVRAPR